MKRNTQKQINRAYHARIKNMLKGQTEKEIFDALAAGKNTYMRLDRLQSSSFDVSWIEMIEGVIFDLGEIIANPRQNTKVVGNIVPVELARKTGAESVQHLASHTQYVKEIDEYGNVIPSKIMTMVSEDDLHTYENRFIATLVRRLVLFVEKRYEVVSELAELRNEEVLMFKNKSMVNGAEVEIETKVKVSYKNDDDMARKSSSYIERIKQIREYILYFYNSSFMKQLKTERDVRNPILQTNIIRKNPKYHHCYEVYRFIETYDRLGVSYKIDENFSIFNEEELNELNHTLFANYVTLRGKDLSDNHKTITHVYKPRILTSSDDEQFIYGPYLKGPISFVRVDEGYQQYLDSKIRKDLPLHPTKKEKEYYADEYEEKRQNKEDLKQKTDLLKRKNKELAAFEKSVQKILKEREEARLKLLALEKEIIEKEENELLTKAREEIIAASLRDQKNVDETISKEAEERKLAEIRDSIANTKVVEASHPESKPVTYDEAVLDIWPNVANAPALRVAEKEEEPVAINEQPVANETPQEVKVIEATHPYSEPVTYEQAALQIWPNLKDAPALRVAPKDETSDVQPVIEAKPVAPEQPVSAPIKEVPQQVKVVELSHPYSEPVTYEEAALQIWPNLKDAPALRVASEEEAANEPQVIEQAPVEETPQEIKVVKATHPYSEPVTYEQAALQIWPQLANEDKHVFDSKPTPVRETPVQKAPAKVKKAAPKAKVQKVNKVQPVVQQVPANEEQPQPKVVEMSHPYSEPVTYDEAALEIWPQLAIEDKHVFDKPEVPNKEEPKEEAPKAKRASAPRKKKPAAKKAAPKKVKEEKPVEVPAPQPVEQEPIQDEAPVVEAPIEEAQVVEETPVVEEAPQEQPKAVKKQVAKKKAPALKEAPKAKAPAKKSKPKAKKEKPAAKPVEAPREKIPGRFIVKTHNGYYINKGKYSVYKEDAKVFDDFNLAKDIKKALGGKIVKL
ncbi:MAG: hypothetical protein IJR08_01220 [Bacilli bacterium]|nr:hypothetical protein [Bacilli bacterium]